MSFKNKSVAIVARVLLCGSAAAFTVGVVGPAIAQGLNQPAVTQSAPAAAPLTEQELAAKIQEGVSNFVAANPGATSAQIRQAAQDVILANPAPPAVVNGALGRAQTAMNGNATTLAGLQSVPRATAPATTPAQTSRLAALIPPEGPTSAIVNFTAVNNFGLFAGFIQGITFPSFGQVLNDDLIIGAQIAQIIRVGPYATSF